MARRRRRPASTVVAASASGSALVLALLVALNIAGCALEVSAKRGCSAFGHSCYGGHGKRSYPDDVPGEPMELQSRAAKAEEEAAAAAVLAAQLDYDLMAGSNAEPVGEVGLAERQRPMLEYGSEAARGQRQLQQQRQRASPPAGSNSWSTFVRKLLLPLRRPYTAYSETQK